MRRIRAAAVAALLLMASLVVAGCGGSAVSPAAPSPAVPASSPTASQDPGAASSTPSAALSGDPSAAASPLIPIDQSLLQVLPATIDGLDRQHDPSIDASAFADPDVANVASAGVTALYIDPASGEFAYAAVVRLGRGGITDAQFRAWRDTFDAGACSQAGAVAGHAQATIGGHTTYIGRCTGGLTTYHTLLADAGLLVSVSSVGQRSLGEQVIAGLQP